MVKKYLILCPHPDDEIHINFSLLVEKPQEVIIAVFTTGKAGVNENDINCVGSDLVSLRYSETILAMNSLGISPEQVIFLGYKDGRENESETMTNKQDRVQKFVLSIEYLCSIFNPEEVYAPMPQEVHIDHKYIGLALLKSNISAKKIFSCYPKTISVPEPNYTLLLSDDYFQKRLNICKEFYKSQVFLHKKLAQDEFRIDRYWYADSIEKALSDNEVYEIKNVTKLDANFRYLFDTSNSKKERVQKVLTDKYLQTDPWGYTSLNYEKVRFDFLANLIISVFDKDTQIVDMGCGNGAFSQRLYQNGFRNITGFDTVENAINEAKQCFSNIQFIVNDFINGLLYLKTNHIKVDLFMFNDCLYYIHITEFLQVVQQIQANFPKAEIFISGGSHLDMKEFFASMLTNYKVLNARSLSKTSIKDELIAIHYIPINEKVMEIQTSKHIAPPVLAFLIVAKKNAVLQKLPKIADVDYMLSVMKSLDYILCDSNESTFIESSDYSLEDWTKFESNIRQNLLFLPICVYQTHTILPIPHGDVIGARPIDDYFHILSQFGYSAIVKDNHIEVIKENNIFPKKINLGIDSTGISILAMTMVVLLANDYRGNGINEIEIHNVSRDLEVEWFVDFINKNTQCDDLSINYNRKNDTVEIKPNSLSLKEVLTYHIPNDRVVLFDMIMFIGGKLFSQKSDAIFYFDIEPTIFENIIGIPVLNFLKEIGFDFGYTHNKIQVSYTKIISKSNKIYIEASKYPELSTDMLPILATFLKIFGYDVTTYDKYFETRQPLLFQELLKLESTSVSVWESSNIRQTVCGLFCMCFTSCVSSVFDYNSSIFRGYEKDFIDKIESITDKKIKTSYSGTQIKFELWN